MTRAIAIVAAALSASACLWLSSHPADGMAPTVIRIQISVAGVPADIVAAHVIRRNSDAPPDPPLWIDPSDIRLMPGEYDLILSADDGFDSPLSSALFRLRAAAGGAN